MDAFTESPQMEALAPAKTLVKPEIRVGLESKKQRLEQQLADVNAALQALDANPEVAKLLELVGRASRY